MLKFSFALHLPARSSSELSPQNCAVQKSVAANANTVTGLEPWVYYTGFLLLLSF